MRQQRQLKGENLEAEALAQWLRLSHYTFSHIANESWLPPKVAMLASVRKKRMWVTPGVPDYIIILKRWALLFIELKKKRTHKEDWEFYALSSDHIKVSEEQQHWVESLSKLDNVDAHIVFWAEEAIKLIQYLETK
jgi:hypothetical protein